MTGMVAVRDERERIVSGSLNPGGRAIFPP